MKESQINQLLVLHRPKDLAGHGMASDREAQLVQHGFFLDTCLRQLAIIDAPHAPEYLAARVCADDPRIELYHGAAAYSFLLKTATGLNSSIPGETNILGQFKQAWSRWREQAAPEQVRRLHAPMHRLFSDSRKIRQNYLQGIGGNSYGTLVRKILAPAADSQLLFVGAGKLAHSMIPLFGAFDLAIWNHQPMKITIPKLARFFPAASAREAAQWATHVVITTPAEPDNDQLWAKLTDTRKQHVVHLGRRRAEPGIWSNRANYYDLDDVFDLRSQQSSLRTLQICRAQQACAQLAVINDGATSTIAQRSALA